MNDVSLDWVVTNDSWAAPIPMNSLAVAREFQAEEGGEIHLVASESFREGRRISASVPLAELVADMQENDTLQGRGLGGWVVDGG